MRTKKRDHITPVLRELHWLPISKRIEFKILLVTYKCLNGLAPSFLSDLLNPYQPKRNLRSTQHQLLHIPPTRLKTYGDRAFSVIGPTLWNKLPLKIRASPTAASFKKSLKTHLFGNDVKAPESRFHLGSGAI